MTAFFSSLTSKQKKVYSAIETYLQTNNIPPTVREIGEMVGEKTPGAVQGILNRLEQKGVIKRNLGMARSIQLVSPDDTLYVKAKYIPELKKISQRNYDDLFNVYNVLRYHPFSSELLEESKSYFMLKCPDNSLTKHCICYDDLLLIEPSEDLKSQDIVVILYDNHVLLRHYYPTENENECILKADFDILNKEVFQKNELKIIGKVIAKMNFY